MALKFEVKSLDEVPEALRGEYEKHGDVYRLKVEGIDPADELKNALAREREERRTAKERVKELEDEKLANANASAEKNKEFENLWRNEKARADKLNTDLDNTKKSIADKSRAEVAASIAGKLTRDTARADLLKEKAMAFVMDTPDGVKIQGPNGETTAEQVSAFLTKTYPFLVDGTQAGGGGAGGGSGGGATKKFTDYNGAELVKLRRENPAEYDRIHAEYKASKKG